MFGWIADTVGSIGEWLGDGIASFFDWLLGGIVTVLTAIVDAAASFFDVLDALWDFAVGFKDNLFGLFTAFFPFVPEAVVTVISLGLLAVLIAGIVKKVRKE